MMLMLFRALTFSTLLLSAIDAGTIAAPLSAEALTAAGAIVKQDAEGQIIEVRFKGPAVDRAILARLPELP